MKVVIDPNVLVSAAVASGASSQLIDRWLTERPFELIVCPMLIDELRDVLTRDKFRRWLTRQDAQRFVDRLDTEADNRPDPTEIPAVTDDPKDDYLVALYPDNDADLLVSGDNDLLDLTAADVTVITPAELLDQV